MNFKKFLSAACIATLCVSGCGTTNTTSSPTDGGDMDEGHYGNLIADYQKSITDNDCRIVTNQFPGEVKTQLWKMPAPQYAIYDINEDENPELLIANSQDLISVFGMQEEEVVSLFQGGVNNTYKLCKDGRIRNEKTFDSIGGTITYFELEKDTNEINPLIQYDYRYENDNSLRFSKTIDFKSEDIDREEYVEGIEDYTERTNIKWKDFKKSKKASSSQDEDMNLLSGYWDGSIQTIEYFVFNEDGTYDVYNGLMDFEYSRSGPYSVEGDIVKLGYSNTDYVSVYRYMSVEEAKGLYNIPSTGLPLDDLVSDYVLFQDNFDDTVVGPSHQPGFLCRTTRSEALN